MRGVKVKKSRATVYEYEVRNREGKVIALSPTMKAAQATIAACGGQATMHPIGKGSAKPCKGAAEKKRVQRGVKGGR